MTADVERLGKIASIGQDLITTQLTMATQTPSQALEGTWVLGYCFGIFDALGQQANLDDGAESGLPHVAVPASRLESGRY